MKLYYALYDQATFDGGDYWNWSASEIRPLLNRFHSDIAAKHLPPYPNNLQNSDLWGGIARLNDWVVVYRYFNGGWDKLGRPGRFVLLTAWIPTDQAYGYDLEPIFTNDTFLHVAENAKKIPVPPPFALYDNWEGVKLPTASFQEGETSFANFEEALSAFAGIPLQRKAKFAIANLKIIKTEKEQSIVLNVAPKLDDVFRKVPERSAPAQKPALSQPAVIDNSTQMQDRPNKALPDTPQLLSRKNLLLAISILVFFVIFLVREIRVQKQNVKGLHKTLCRREVVIQNLEKQVEYLKSTDKSDLSTTNTPENKEKIDSDTEKDKSTVIDNRQIQPEQGESRPKKWFRRAFRR